MNCVIQRDLLDICMGPNVCAMGVRNHQPEVCMIPFTQEDSVDIENITRNMYSGDEDAFNEFYDRYAHRIYSYLLSISRGDEHLSRDAMQDALMRIIRYIRPHTDETVFWRWLKRISRTSLYDILRKNSTYSRHLSLLREEYDDNCDAPVDKHETRWRAAIDRALAGISESGRKLIEGFYFEGYSQLELAKQHNTTRKAVESKLARLREKLRAELVRALNEE
jgi:RNA polymerase sigma factor (sigma-70 family)